MAPEEAGDQARKVLAHRGGVAQDMHPGSCPAPQVLQIALHPLHLLQDGPGMAQDGGAGVGEGDPLLSSHQQRPTQRVFHSLDPFAGGSRREESRLGPRADRPSLDDIDEELQVGEVVTHALHPG